MQNQQLINISRFFSPGKMTRIDSDSPLFKAEKSILVARKDRPKGKIFYENFNTNLENYMLKLPNNIAKKSVHSIYTRDLVYVGRNDGNIKSGIIGAVYLPKGRLSAIVLDSSELDIDIVTGDTHRIDSVFYAAYHLIIRAAVITNERAIVRDENIHALCCHYLTFIMLKILGSRSLLNAKQQDFLQVITKYFYIRFMLQYHHSLARDNALSKISEEYRDEADSLMPTLQKYSNMKDIFKACVDYRITSENPSMLLVRTLNRFKPLTFYSIISSLDYIIATAIISYYPVDFFAESISDSIQTQLEKNMEKYIRMLKFDVNSMKKL